MNSFSRINDINTELIKIDKKLTRIYSHLQNQGLKFYLVYTISSIENICNDGNLVNGDEWDRVEKKALIKERKILSHRTRTASSIIPV